MKKLALVVLVAPLVLPGCILLGPAVAYGIVFAAADKGVKYRYDAPLHRVRGVIDGFCRDEAIEIQTSEDNDRSSLRKGRTSDNRRIRIEAMSWDAEATIVFIHVGVSGDTYAGERLHDRFAELMKR